MRAVIVLSAIFAALAVSQGTNTAITDMPPDILYNTISPAGLDTTTAYASAPLAACSNYGTGGGGTGGYAAMLFSTYTTPQGGKIYHTDATRGTTMLLWAQPDAIFRDPPVCVSPFAALIFSRGSASSAGYVGVVDYFHALNHGAGHPLWTRSTDNATVAPAIMDEAPYNVITALGNNRIAAYNLSTANEQWVQNVTGPISDLLYKEGRVLLMDNDTLISFSAASGSTSATFQKQYPCGFVPDIHAGNTMRVRNIIFGWDHNGPLTAIIIYGDTIDPTTGVKMFSICRAHHGSFSFGESEWTHQIAGEYEVLDVTGGAGGIFFNIRNLNSNEYSIKVFNASGTGGAFQREIFREPIDKFSAPEVLPSPLNDATQPPYLIFQLNGSLTGMNLWTNAKAFEYIGQNCARQPVIALVGSTFRAFCMPYYDNAESALSSYTYSRQVWRLPATVAFSVHRPVVVGDIALMVQTRTGVIGLSLDASITNPPSPSGGGTSAGVVVLVIIMLILMAAIAVLGVRWYRGRGQRRSVSSRTALDKEGYAGLNA